MKSIEKVYVLKPSAVIPKVCLTVANVWKISAYKMFGYFKMQLTCFPAQCQVKVKSPLESLPVHVYAFLLYYSDFNVFNCSVSWSKDGRVIEDSGRFTFSQDDNSFSFEIPAALATDSGVYSFEAKDSRGSCGGTFTLSVAVSLSPCADIDVIKLINSLKVR